MTQFYEQGSAAPVGYMQLPSAPQTFRRKKAKRFQAKMICVL